MLFAVALLSSAQDSFRLVAERLDTFTVKAFSRSLIISSTLAFVSLQTQEQIVLCGGGVVVVVAAVVAVVVVVWTVML